MSVRQGMGSPSHQCSIPLTDDKTNNTVYFDIENAEPGAFVDPPDIPSHPEPQVYEPGVRVSSQWLYFKGDPGKGSQPGHPFEMPFDNGNTSFALDLVDAENQSNIIRRIMEPADSKPFWDGGAPFGNNGDHMMYLGRLGMTCKYYSYAMLAYRWIIPEDLGRDTDYRLKLTTDEPATTHFSGEFRIPSTEGTAQSPSQSSPSSSLSESPSSLPVPSLPSEDLSSVAPVEKLSGSVGSVTTVGAFVAIALILLFGVWRLVRIARASRKSVR